MGLERLTSHQCPALWDACRALFLLPVLPQTLLLLACKSLPVRKTPAGHSQIPQSLQISRLESKDSKGLNVRRSVQRGLRENGVTEASDQTTLIKTQTHLEGQPWGDPGERTQEELA